MYMHLYRVREHKTSGLRLHIFLRRIGYINFRLEHKIKLFGDTGMDLLFNLIIIIAKQVIYLKRGKEGPFSVRYFETTRNGERIRRNICGK